MMTKSDIAAAINDYLPTEMQYSNYSTELDYIQGLQGIYQEIAINQAALGFLIRMAADPERQENFKQKIEQLGKEVAAHEVELYNSKQAWTDKYGGFNISKIDKKVTVMPVQTVPKLQQEETEPKKWELANCEKCNDTGIIKYGALQAQLCTCEAGNKRLEESIKHKEQQYILEKYYDKTFIENLKANSPKLVESVINGKPTVLNTKPVEPEKFELPEPKGRKFR